MSISLKSMFLLLKAGNFGRRKIADFIMNRTPLSVTISVCGLEPSVCVTVVNKSPSIPLFVHAIRAHFGSENFSRSFKLDPPTTTEVKPKAKCEWVFSFVPFETLLGEHIRQKEKPKVSPPDLQPGIAHPSQLFNAIGMGSPDNSWLEIDFNEYERREFQRGEVQEAFARVRSHRDELRRMAKDKGQSDNKHLWG